MTTRNYDLPNQERRFVDLFHALLQVPSPSGREWEMADKISALVKEIGYETERDTAGNLLVRLEGSDTEASPCIFAAHMDEIGVVVRHINDDGSLLVDKSGGLVPYKLGERPLQFLGDNETIIALPNLGHGHGGGQFTSGIAWEDITISTGLSQDQLKKAGIRPGTTGVPIAEGRGPVVFGNKETPLVAAWLLDNRGGIAVQLEAMRLLKEQGIKPRRPIIFAFTVHEEGGCHGAKILAFREKPEILVSIDICPITPHCGAALTEHPTILSRDRLAHHDQRMVATLLKACEIAGTEGQTVVSPFIATDASASYNAGSVPRVAAIGFPVNNSHGFEVATLAVFPNLSKTIVSLLSLEDW